MKTASYSETFVPISTTRRHIPEDRNTDKSASTPKDVTSSDEVSQSTYLFSSCFPLMLQSLQCIRSPEILHEEYKLRSSLYIRPLFFTLISAKYRVR
jgi:hypothetical protein